MYLCCDLFVTKFRRIAIHLLDWTHYCTGRMSITGHPIFQNIVSTIKTGDITKVQSLLEDWRCDSDIPGPAPSDIDWLVPHAAEGTGQPTILEYLLSQATSDAIDVYTIGQARSVQIFEIFIKHG